MAKAKIKRLNFELTNTIMYKYIEVISYKNNEIVKRVDVTGKTERSIDTIENGMNRNMNHEEYFTIQDEQKIPLRVF